MIFVTGTPRTMIISPARTLNLSISGCEVQLAL
jgi:hypothetical protein